MSMTNAIGAVGTPKTVTFTDDQVNFIAVVEKHWWEQGAVPTNERISEILKLSNERIQDYWKNENIRGALLHRGVDFNPKSDGLLTLQQLDLANVLLNYADTSTLREKLNRVGVTTQQYNAWKRQAAFSNYITKRAEQMFENIDAEALESLTNAVRAGDMKAVQMVMEMKGRYSPRMGIEVQNIQSVLVRVVEIVTRYVHDPEVLQQIANDFEELGLTGTVGPKVEQKAIEAVVRGL